MLQLSDRFQADQLLQTFHQTRQRTQSLFNLMTPDAYYQKPIPLRHPIVFYEGHIPAFLWNTLFRRVLHQDSFHPAFDQLFARGIDPGDVTTADTLNQKAWPERQEVQAYCNEIYKRLDDFLASFDGSKPAHPLLAHGHVLYLLLEHEWMHQETLMYILHQLPPSQKQVPANYPEALAVPAPQSVMCEVPEGPARLGAAPGEFPFVWDNEQPHQDVHVPAFAMDAYNVTNGDFLNFIDAGGYYNPVFWDDETWAWREQHAIEHPFFWKKKDKTWWLKDFFDDRPLPLSWPVVVTHAEARAYARFVNKSLPTEAEWTRAAVGDHMDWPYPWGHNEATAAHGNIDFYRYSPVTVGQFPKGQSPFGMYDLVGNGWEWTSTPFEPFPGFYASEGYPQYSADFFDGQHYVLKGGSHVTDARLLRRSFRNWFYWHYPYMYATFRCVKRH